MGALDALGNATDWLQDAEWRSLRLLRMGYLDAIDAAWDEPLGPDEFDQACQAAIALCQGLDHNKLYPHNLLLGADAAGGEGGYLMRERYLRQDFGFLRDFCVQNEFGIGEVHLLFAILLLYRALLAGEYREEHRDIEEDVGGIVRRTAPGVLAENKMGFSGDCVQRVEAVRAVRVMKALGMLGEAERDPSATPEDIGEPTPPDQASEIDRLLPRVFRFPYRIMAYGRYLEAQRLAFAQRPNPDEAPSIDRAARRLIRTHRWLLRSKRIDDRLRHRLLRITEALLVRSMAPFPPAVGLRIYGYLRSRETDKPKMHHGRMFELLKSADERVQLLNFLYRQGKRNPVFYTERFGCFFAEQPPRFSDARSGFVLGEGNHDVKAAPEQPKADEAAPGSPAP